MAKIKGIAAVKEASGNLSQIADIIRGRNDVILSGANDPRGRDSVIRVQVCITMEVRRWTLKDRLLER